MVCLYLENLQKEYLEQKIIIDKSMANLQVKLKENIKFLKMLEEDTDASYESFSPRQGFRMPSDVSSSSFVI